MKKSIYLFLLAIPFLFQQQVIAQCGQVIDLNSWTAQGGNSDWAVNPGGTSVNQNINGAPTYFVNDFDVINVELSGKFEVNTNDDNDFAGFVFGYRDPLTLSTDNNDFYLFSTAKNESSPHDVADCENFFGHVKGKTSLLDLFDTFSATLPATIDQYLCDDTSFPGWTPYQEYSFTCRFTSTNVTILIDNVEVVNVDGCFHPGRFGFYNLSQREVRYSDYTYQVISDFNIANDSICLGTSADLDIFCDPSFQSPYTSTIWNMGDGTTYNDIQNISHEYANTGVYNVTLTTEDANGCTDSKTKTITVFDPVFDLGTAITHCVNEQDEQELNVTMDSPDTYDWSTGENSQAITVNQSGSYFVDVVDQAGCTASDTIDVTFNDQPTATYSFNDTCFHDTTFLTDQSVPNSSNMTSYQWFIDDDVAPAYTISNPTHVFSNTGIHQVDLIVENNLGCFDTISHTVNSYDLPEADFTATDECLMTQATFSNTSTINSGTISNFDWDFGDGNTSAVENPTNQYSNDSIYNATLIVTSDFGCKDTVSDSISVYSLPAVDFNATDACIGSVTNFTDQTTIDNSNTTNNLTNWSWDLGDGNTSTQQNPTNQYSTDGIFDVSLIVTSNHGCKDTINNPAIVYPLPDVSFSPTSVCLDSNTVFTDQSSIATDVTNNTLTNWNWDFGDGSTSTDQNPIHTYSTPGTFTTTLEVISDHNCSSTITETVTVYLKPTASFTADPMLTDIGNTTVNFTNTSSNATGYTWNFGDNSPFNYDVNPTHFFPNSGPGSYNVLLLVESSEGCVNSSIETIIIDYPSITYTIPNVFTPNEDGDNDFFKMINAEYITELEVVILNRWGNVVFESSDVGFNWNGLNHNNGAACTDGTYFYKINLKRVTGKEYMKHGFVQLLRGK